MSAPITVEVFRTARDTGERLTPAAPLTFGTDPELAIPSIFVDPSKRFQVMEGFGGAITESAAVTFAKMDPAAQAAILKAYFDPDEGHGYTLCRTHINSCDFSLGNYAYDEIPEDHRLDHFTIERDRRALIPFIRAAMKAAGGSLKLFHPPGARPLG